MKRFFLGLFIGLAAALLVMIALTSVPAYGDKIAIVRIKGTITSSSSLFEETVSPEEIFPILESIEEDPSIKGVLIEINSPGGSVVASREIAMAVRDMDKPTVCWLGDLAASGAYWIASSCDTIVADPLTLTGSIGVTASYLQFSGTMEKYGVTYERFVSGEYKDTGSPFRNLTEKEEEGMMRLVNETFEYFLDDVRDNRGLSNEVVESIKSGGMYLGKDAVRIGLVDELGTWKDAKELAKNRTGTANPSFVEMQKKGLSIFNLLYGLG